MSKTFYTAVIDLVGEFEPTAILNERGEQSPVQAVTIYLEEDGRVRYLKDNPNGPIKSLGGLAASGVSLEPWRVGRP